MIEIQGKELQGVKGTKESSFKGTKESSSEGTKESFFKGTLLLRLYISNTWSRLKEHDPK